MNIGILGAGNIAGTMAETIRMMAGNGEDVSLYAIGSRSERKAESFAMKNGCNRAYGSYEDLLRDPNVDLVYIATPHSEHYINMLLCLNYNKPVLCEKSFTANADQARKITTLAELKKIPLSEAIWTRYMPMRKIINDVLSSGAIGIPRTITANLSYNVYKNERLHRPDLAGGALLDVGIYPINFAEMVFGHADGVNATAIMSEDGVDETDSITLTWDDGRAAVLTAGIKAISDRSGIIYGDEGYAVVDNINNPERIRIYDLSRENVKTIEAPNRLTGYEYEIREMHRIIEEEEIECPSMPHDESVHIMEVMDHIRAQIGYKFPFES